MAADDSDITAVQMQELEESTSCCICTDIYKFPKLLPCGHTFCMTCIQETGLKASKGPGDEMSCPVCRQQFKIPSEGFSGLQSNYYVEGLIRVAKILDPSVTALTACDACLEEGNQGETGKEVQRADMYCIDCMQNLCEECCRHHRKLKLTKNHKLISLNEQNPADTNILQSRVPSVCELHKQEDLKIYCRLCKTVICSICFFENHEGHKGSHVTKIVDEFRKELANNIETVESFISQAQLKKSEIMEAIQAVHKKLESLESEIMNRRDYIKQIADKHANSLLDQLCLLKQSRLKEIKIETDDIDAHLSRLESHNSYCKKIMAKGSACDICRANGALSARMNELQQENQPLSERKPKLFTLCFVGGEFEEKDGENVIGQLTEQDNPKLKTKIEQRLIEDLNNEVETLKTEIKSKRSEILQLASEKLKVSLDNEDQVQNIYKLQQELNNEKSINRALQAQIDNLAEQLNIEKMTKPLLQVEKDKLLFKSNPSNIFLGSIDQATYELERTKTGCLKQEETLVGEQNEAGNHSRDQTGSSETLELQPLKEVGESILRRGEENSNSEIFNHGKKNKKRRRKLIRKNKEINVIQTKDKDMSRDDLEKGGTSTNTEHPENLKHQDRYQELPPLKNIEYSENLKHQDRYQDLPTVKNIEDSEVLKHQDIYKDSPVLKNMEYSENLKHQDRYQDLPTMKKIEYSENLKIPERYLDFPTTKTTEHSENLKHEVRSHSENEEHSENLKDDVRYLDAPTSKNTEHSENLKYEASSPPLTTSKNIEYSENLKHPDRYLDFPTAKNTEHLEILKHQADHQDSPTYPDILQNPTNTPELNRICALMLHPSVDIDGDIFNYLIRHQNYELSRISEKCNLFETYKVEQQHKLAVEVKPNHDIDSVRAEFRKLCDHATVHYLGIPGGVDNESLKSSIEAMVEFIDVELRVMSTPGKERVCKIVGSSGDVTRANQMLLDVMAATNADCNASANTNVQMTGQLTHTPNGTEPTSSAELNPATTASNVQQARRSAFRVLNHTHDSLLLSDSNLLTIEVRRGKLTRIRDLDVVVSYISHRLETDGPLADQVIKAAGPSVKKELFNLKSRMSFLHTGRLVHTSGGNLRGVKALMHVVRPQSFKIPAYEQTSRDVLKNLFTNCFGVTNYELKLNSICLPPVGFSLYGAEIVANCFLDAVEILASAVANPSATPEQNPHHLKYIQLISNDSFCVGQLIKYIRQRLDA